MPDAQTRPLNSFMETLIGMEYVDSSKSTIDLFSRACVDQFRDADPTRFGYLFTQVFEPGVLLETALLAGIAHTTLTSLEHRPTPAMTRLAEVEAHAVDLSVVELVNLASALISVSRFEKAAGVLALAAERESSPREVFEVAMLEFMVANRTTDGRSSPRSFRRMRAAVETGAIPPDRVLHACTQAVVWYLKRRELDDDNYHWFVRLGHDLVAKPETLHSASLSAWYRGVAMVPAAQRDTSQTRHYMEQARETAEDAVRRSPRAYELNLIKTYHESSLKEHMHVTRNFDKAKESGFALIALDRSWAPSYGELAEVYQKFGKVEQAARLFERAAELGPPYYGNHLYSAARCRELLEHFETAVEHYLRLSAVAPLTEPAARAGLAAASRVSHPAVEHFRRVLEHAGERRRSAAIQPTDDL